MPAKDIGAKFSCFKCGTKFYDLKRPEPVCPKCGVDQRESPALKGPPDARRGRLTAVPKVVQPIAPEEPFEEEDEIEAIEEEAEEPAREEEEV
ncbi:MAG: FYDLN acid domain-containing protein [Myxococcales bacterium]|nr:FYDLN acid domain-containing protein [Myxococcales bacterium]